MYKMKETKFKSTELGPIPVDWEVKRLGDVCSITTGHKDVNQGCKNGKYPFFTCSRNVFTANSYSFDCEAILVAGNGDVGNLHYYKGKFEAYQRTYVLKDFSEDVSYILHELTYNLMRCLSDGKIGSSIPYITIQQLEGFMYPLPPLAEQKAIAEALSDVDALIAAQEELIEKKRAIKQGAMQELLTGKKRLPGFGGKCRQESLETEDFNAEAQRRRGSECKMTEVGLIPVDWEVKRLGDVGSFSKGAGISKAQANSGKIPAVRYGELYTTHHNYIKKFESFISDEVAKESTQLTYGDIVFACSGETKEEIGKCAAFLGSEVAYAGGDLIILSPRTGYDSKFLAFELNAPFCALQKASAGHGDAVVHIRRESLENLIVVVPSLAEQKAIAEVLSDMDAEISELEAQKAKFESIKQGMMQELLTGKTRLV